MSVTVRAYRNGGWMVEINTRLPNGTRHRDRKRLTIGSKSAAKVWGQERERHLLQHGLPQPTKEVPTLEAFAPRFMEGHTQANRQKPSSTAAQEMIVRVHLVPALGEKRLDTITNEDVQRLKHRLLKKAAKTTNNVLTVLNVMLKKAVEWGVIDRLPCKITVVPVSIGSASFYDFDEFERLVVGANATDWRAHVLVLLGAQAGLRSGEMVGLEWPDLDLEKGLVCVQRSVWKGQVGSTKGNRLRHVPLTLRLCAALREARHQRGPRVLYDDDGSPLTEGKVQGFIKRAARHAGLPSNGPHRLRHTFCSHLAMRGALVGAIQLLAGHADLRTTLRYMHLSPAAPDHAIRLLEVPQILATHGNIVATGMTEAMKSLQ